MAISYVSSMCRQHLRDADQIFLSKCDSASERVQVMKIRPKKDGATSYLELAESNNIDEMKEETKVQLRSNSSRSGHTIYILSQKSTWSRLRISYESFRSIVDVHGLDENIFDVAQAFRNKVREVHQFRWSACYTRLTAAEAGHFEICYRIQYPVRNNRNWGDPFSMRQTGICHKSSGSFKSIWILLQPSAEVASALKSMASDPGFVATYENDPMFLHTRFLSFQRANWDDYLEYLRTQLEPLNEAAHFARVSTSGADSDYFIDFKDCQKLLKLQWKITQILPAIEGNISALKTCEDRWQATNDRSKVQAALLEIRSTMLQLEFHLECMKKLAKQAIRSAELFYRILDFRTSKQIQGTSTAMSKSLEILNSEARDLTLLSKERDKDSKTMKALSSIATLYLPVTLVATIFQSNLIQVVPPSSTPQPTRFLVAPQSWLPFLLAISLTVLTVASAPLLERLYRLITKKRNGQ